MSYPPPPAYPPAPGSDAAGQVRPRGRTPRPRGWIVPAVAVAASVAGGTMVGALLIVVGVLFLIAAIVLLIVGFVKRSRHKKELQSGPKWGTWGAPAPAYGGAPQPYPPPPGYGDPHQPPPGYGGPHQP